MASSQPLQCVTRLPQVGQGCFAALPLRSPRCGGVPLDGTVLTGQPAVCPGPGSSRVEVLRRSLPDIQPGRPGSGKGVIPMIKLWLCQHQLELLTRAVKAYQPA